MGFLDFGPAPYRWHELAMTIRAVLADLQAVR